MNSRALSATRACGPREAASSAAVYGWRGVANTRARLVELYGERQKFELVNKPEGGLCVRITIPFSTSEA